MLSMRNCNYITFFRLCQTKFYAVFTPCSSPYKLSIEYSLYDTSSLHKLIHFLSIVLFHCLGYLCNPDLKLFVAKTYGYDIAYLNLGLISLDTLIYLSNLILLLIQYLRSPQPLFCTLPGGRLPLHNPHILRKVNTKKEEPSFADSPSPLMS